jgi:hypothetical protein
VKKSDCANVANRLEAVKEVLRRLSPDFLSENFTADGELYFSAGEEWKARQTLYRLMKRASVSLDIVDPYLDADVFEFLESIDAAVVLRLVTSNPKPLFLYQSTSALSQHGAGRGRLAGSASAP